MVASSLLTFFMSIVAAASFVEAHRSSALQTDLAYEKTAHKLELLRNQMELTIYNRRGSTADVARQRRELRDFDIFLRVPLEEHDLKNDAELLDSIRTDFKRAPAGSRLVSMAFASRWQAAPARVPRTLAFDEGARIPEDQVADSRRVRLTFEFTGQPPARPDQWLRGRQHDVRRLLVPEPAKKWKRQGRKLTGYATIHRFRALEYPKFIAPDLSRYELPGKPSSPVQEAAAKRAQRYRGEITTLWPRTQPFLDDLRAFALNDLRMNFYMKRASSH